MGERQKNSVLIVVPHARFARNGVMHLMRTDCRSNRVSGLFGSLFLLVLACFLWGTDPLEAEPSSVTGKELGSKSTGQVVVTYFHTTFRCPTCTLLEKYSRETVENHFANELKDDKVVFRAINLEDPEHQHFIRDYGLYTKSLVLSLNINGKEIRWKNLPDIWRLVHNRERFEQYVQSEIQAYLKDL